MTRSIRTTIRLLSVTALAGVPLAGAGGAAVVVMDSGALHVWCRDTTPR